VAGPAVAAATAIVVVVGNSGFRSSGGRLGRMRSVLSGIDLHFQGLLMAGRGPQTFKKKQKEQARKEKRQEKIARKLERKRQGPSENETVLDNDQTVPAAPEGDQP
jgi:hypothetical protein